jgi:transcriptional regulator with XRE-family HTH domain
MNEDRQELPFKTLGEKLKTIRQKLHESVAEVSGAVEIDEQVLQRFEQGHERPSEDILLLLINHFGVQDDEAAGLWQLAGYDQPHQHERSQNQGDSQSSRTMVMIMAVDPRVIYSDGVQVTANASGVILGFSQGIGTPQALTTARIGMSREQAYGLLRTLHHSLEASQPRQLPPAQPDAPKPSAKKHNSQDKSE